MRDIPVLAALDLELAPLRWALRDRPVRLVRTGVGPRQALAATRRTVAEAPPVLVSTGCCGALVPELAPGGLVLACAVLRARDGEAEAAPAPDPTWRAAARAVAAQLGLDLVEGPLITVAEALQTGASKRTCHDATGAVAVDMETAAVARLAGRAGVPYLAVRFVLDRVDDELPGVSLQRRPDEGWLGRLRTLTAEPARLGRLIHLGGRLVLSSGPLGRLLRELLR